MKKKVVVHPIEVLEQNFSPTIQRTRQNSDAAVTSPDGVMMG
jgi:hypothetical protein